MNSENLKRLGRVIKSKYPEYAAASDEEVGRIIAAKYPQYAKDLSLPAIPVLTGSEVTALEGESAKLTKYAGYLATRDAVTTQVQGIRHKAETDRTAHEMAITQVEAQKAIIEKALEHNMDPANYGVVRVEQERAGTEVVKAKKMAAIKILENKHLERNRLQAYEREANIDMQAALGMHMMDVEKLDYMAHKIARLKKENAEPERIAALERVRVQMERRLLEADDQEDVAGIDPPSEG